MNCTPQYINTLNQKAAPARCILLHLQLNCRKRRTIVEPDISVICDRSKLTERGCTGAPDWIIEIVSPGNSSYDYIRKLNLYADAKVREYWIINPINCTVLVYHLEESKFEVALYTFQDKIKVNIYDDLWIDFAEIDA